MEASMSQRVVQRTLDDRIASAFLPGAISTDVEELIANAEAAAASSEEAVEVARAQALDPTLPTEKVQTARQQMEDAAFRRDRLRMAVTKLRDRLQQLKAQEDNERRWQAYEKAKAERDKLVAELKDVYPSYAARLADLAARIKANDKEVDRINLRAVPEGAEWLRSVELVARDLKGWNDGTATVPRIVRDLRLPAFEYDRHVLNVWPRS
jgi:hypothetical protein